MNTNRLLRAMSAAAIAVSTAVLAQAPRPTEDRHGPRPEWRERQRGMRGDRMGPGARRGDGENSGRPDGRMKELFERLRNQDPERFERLTKLRETDPRAFGTEIREIMQQRFAEHRAGSASTPLDQKCVELSRVYRETADEQKRQGVKVELQTAVEEAFDARVKLRLQRLERMEEEIKRIRREIEARQSGRKEICERRVEELTRNPQYRWEW